MPPDLYGPTGGYYPLWQFWVNQTTTSGYVMNLPQQMAQTTTTNSTVWDGWMANEMNGITFNQPITSAAWNTWNSQPAYVPAAFVPTKPEVTAEQVAKYERHRMVLQNRARARRIREKLARQTAELLLVEFLSETQREQWEKEKAFTVVTADGLREYRIKRGMAGNVTLMKCKEPPMSKGGWPIHIGARFCMHVYHPDGRVPDEDNVLAQKLLLESPEGEAEFLAHANVG